MTELYEWVDVPVYVSQFGEVLENPPDTNLNQVCMPVWDETYGDETYGYKIKEYTRRYYRIKVSRIAKNEPGFMDFLQRHAIRVAKLKLSGQ